MENRRVILSIVIGSLVVSLPYALWVNEAAFSDMWSYEALVESLLSRGEYVFDEEWRAYRSPGLVLYLAAIYALAGPANYLAVRLLQCALFALMNVLLFQVAREIFGRRVALWGVALTILSHEMILWVAKPATEFAYTFLLVLFAWLIVGWFIRGGGLRLVAAAFTIGVAALTRPEAGPIAGMAAVGIALARPPGTPWRTAWRTRIAAAALFSLVFWLVLAPWIVRNYVLFERFVLNTQSGHTLYTSNESLAGPGKSYDEIELPLYDRIRASREPADPALEIQANDYFANEARRNIREQPVAFARLFGRRLWVILTERYVYLTRVPWDSLRYFGRFDIQLVYWNPVLLVAALLGIGIGVARRPPYAWLLIGTIVLTVTIHSVYLGLPRNRVPLRPFLNLFACYGVIHAGLWLRARLARERASAS